MTKTETIKFYLPIQELAEREGLILKKQSTRSYSALCCFHNEKTPSLVFDVGKQTFKCFGCDAYGDVINFYALRHNIDNNQAIEELYNEIEGKAPTFKVVREEKEDQSFSNPFTVKEKQVERIIKERPPTDIYKALLEFCGGVSEEVGEYLKGRGFTEDTIKQFKIVSVDDYQKLSASLRESFSLDRLKKTSLLSEKNHFLFARHTIIFPLIEGGEVVALRGRYFFKGSTKPNKGGKYRSTTGVRHKLINGDSLTSKNEGEVLYLCEGETDVMSLVQDNKNAVGLCGVTNYGESILKRLSNYEVIVAFDNDESGGRGAKRFCKDFFQLTGKKAKIEKLPEGMKDVNELYISRLF